MIDQIKDSFINLKDTILEQPAKIGALFIIAGMGVAGMTIAGFINVGMHKSAVAPLIKSVLASNTCNTILVYTNYNISVLCQSIAFNPYVMLEWFGLITSILFIVLFIWLIIKETFNLGE